MKEILTASEAVVMDLGDSKSPGTPTKERKTNPPAILRRRDEEEELELKGVSGQALQRLLQESALERHRSRAAYARWAAEEYYLLRSRLSREDESEDCLALVAGAILWADAIGIGGRDGVEGASTRRHPAFVACGKGRKQANDGDAWSAAIYSAAMSLECAGMFRINDGSLVFSRTSQDDPTEIAIDKTTIPPAWIVSILSEGLRRAAGRRPWFPAAPFDAASESLAAWAKALNELLGGEQVV